MTTKPTGRRPGGADPTPEKPFHPGTRPGGPRRTAGAPASPVLPGPAGTSAEEVGSASPLGPASAGPGRHSHQGPATGAAGRHPSSNPRRPQTLSQAWEDQAGEGAVHQRRARVFPSSGVFNIINEANQGATRRENPRARASRRASSSALTNSPPSWIAKRPAPKSPSTTAPPPSAAPIRSATGERDRRGAPSRASVFRDVHRGHNPPGKNRSRTRSDYATPNILRKTPARRALPRP